MATTAWRWTIAAALLIAPAAWGAWIWRSVPPDRVGLALTLLSVVIFWLVVLVSLEIAGASDPVDARAGHGFLSVAIGADGRFSTSKTVVAVWTAVFVSALLVLSGLVVFGRLRAVDVFTVEGSTWDSYFLLLGGPFASAVLAKGIVSAKVNDDPSAKTVTSAASPTATGTATTTTPAVPSAKDVISNDSGSLDLVDTQYALFSLVAVLYFAGQFVANVDTFAVKQASLVLLPTIPAPLLGLTSLAALTYVGNKAVQTQGIRVVAFDPPKVAPSGAVSVTLVNLPVTATRLNTTVVWTKEDGTYVQTTAPSADPVNGKVAFTALPTAGTYLVRVVAPDTVTSPAMLVVG